MEIRRAVLDAIHSNLEAAYPLEGCGFLLGSVGAESRRRVTDHLNVPNARTRGGTAARRYLITATAVRQAEREAGRRGLELLGTYHSHPDTSARPSAYDAEHAWPWYRYLIVSIVNGAVHEARVWELRDDRSAFVEHSIRIEES